MGNEEESLSKQFDKRREEIKETKPVSKLSRLESRAEDMKRVKDLLDSLDNKSASKKNEQ
jgi:hypothetical protein